MEVPVTLYGSVAGMEAATVAAAGMAFTMVNAPNIGIVCQRTGQECFNSLVGIAGDSAGKQKSKAIPEGNLSSSGKYASKMVQFLLKSENSSDIMRYDAILK